MQRHDFVLIFTIVSIVLISGLVLAAAAHFDNANGGSDATEAFLNGFFYGSMSK